MPTPATRTHEEHAQAQREYYATHVRDGMLPKPKPYTLRHLNELLEHGAFKPGSRLIDVGCGMGRFSFLLAERGYSVDALDVSQFMIDRLREFDGGRHNIRAWCADLAESPRELHGQFDGVVGFFMLHHFAKLDPIFPAVMKLLKPGARAVFVEPNPWNPLYYVQILSRPDMKWDAEKGMLNLRRKPVFEHMLAAGFEDPQLVRYGFFPPFLRNTPWGGSVERVIERIPGIKPVLPFQIYSCRKPA